MSSSPRHLTCLSGLKLDATSSRKPSLTLPPGKFSCVHWGSLYHRTYCPIFCPYLHVSSSIAWELFAVETIFIDSFHQYLLIIFCVTHIVPDTGDAAMKKNGPTLMRLMSLWWEDRQLTHQAHSMSDSGKCSQHDGKTWEAIRSF